MGKWVIERQKQKATATPARFARFLTVEGDGATRVLQFAAACAAPQAHYFAGRNPHRPDGFNIEGYAVRRLESSGLSS